MDSKQFIRSIRRLARKNSLAFNLDTEKGKGSHVMITLGDRQTTLVERRGDIGLMPSWPPCAASSA
ncbi:MAG: hypothetical protein VCD50_17720 [Alphaproteobacteria bacterium]|jgi:hypothetical protein